MHSNRASDDFAAGVEVGLLLAQAERELPPDALELRIDCALASIEPSPVTRSGVQLPDGLERRFARELRGSASGEDQILAGFACRYGSLSEDLGFRERLQAGCFRDSWARTDVRMLHNHDSARVLGRQSAGTLELTDDRVGLRFRCTLPKSAQDVYESVSRGDTTGMSFGFVCREDAWTQERGEDGNPIQVRTVLRSDLLEVSTVAWPAYQASSVAVATRSLFPSGVVPAEVRSRIGTHLDFEVSDEENAFRLMLRLKAAKLTL